MKTQLSDAERRSLEQGRPEAGDSAARLSLALARLTRVLRRGGDLAGLGPGSISALATLVRSGPMRLGDLALREGVAPPTLTRIVGALEESGYVVRAPDPDDRRATRVQATDSAIELVAGVGLGRVSRLRDRIETLDDDDLRALLRAIPVIEALAADEG
ncbi:MAG TPA: MarR family transcriptional regulator [Kineosporiaceae bacterium]|nr:MarR family transcriptional regulator [Kineosporiaceae bacterium]